MGSFVSALSAHIKKKKVHAFFTSLEGELSRAILTKRSPVVMKLSGAFGCAVKLAFDTRDVVHRVEGTRNVARELADALERKYPHQQKAKQTQTTRPKKKVFCSDCFHLHLYTPSHPITRSNISRTRVRNEHLEFF